MVALACKVLFNWGHRLYSRCTAIPYPGIHISGRTSKNICAVRLRMCELHISYRIDDVDIWSGHIGFRGLSNIRYISFIAHFQPKFDRTYIPLCSNYNRVKFETCARYIDGAKCRYEITYFGSVKNLLQHPLEEFYWKKIFWTIITSLPVIVQTWFGAHFLRYPIL